MVQAAVVMVSLLQVVQVSMAWERAGQVYTERAVLHMGYGVTAAPWMLGVLEFTVPVFTAFTVKAATIIVWVFMVMAQREFMPMEVPMVCRLIVLIQEFMAKAVLMVFGVMPPATVYMARQTGRAFMEAVAPMGFMEAGAAGAFGVMVIMRFMDKEMVMTMLVFMELVLQVFPVLAAAPAFMDMAAVMECTVPARDMMRDILAGTSIAL